MIDVNEKFKLESFPWLENRINPDAIPTYKIIARSMTSTGDSIVMLHEAGCDLVVNYYIQEVVLDEEIMGKLDQKEAELLRWVVKSEIADPLQANK